MNLPLATPEMCAFCFEVLFYKFGMLKKKPYFKTDIKAPCFITWRTKKILRGCIGTFKSKNLGENLMEYAIESAFNDSRFDPINLKEVEDLSCEVSLLSSTVKCKNYLDWELGKDGIIMNYGVYRATYLPDVGIEQGWSKEETLKELLYKSGYDGEINNKVLQNLSLEKYRTSKTELNYLDYLKIKKTQISSELFFISDVKK